jgi:hypothetical protein
LRTWLADPFARLDVAQTIAGSCDWYFLGVFYPPTEIRTLTGITIPNGGPIYANSPTQSLDSRIPGTTSPEGRNLLYTIEGHWVVDFYSTQIPTDCNFEMLSPTGHVTVNALTCKPAWFTDPNNTTNYHAPPGKVTIAVPSDFMNAFSAAQAAADLWHTALGREIEVLPNSVCSGSDAMCVSFKNNHGTLPDDAEGCASLGTASYNPAGEWIGSTNVRFIPDWSNANPGRLQRLIAHELGHYFGLGNRLHASCPDPETVMGSTPDCYSTEPPPNGLLLGARPYLTRS